jgi:nucleoside-diphosphate-sugar epimerase
MRVLIVGCGYVGLPLGAELVRQGHKVFGVRRSGVGSEELTDAGLTPLTADITRPGDLARLPAPFDWVVNTVSSTKGGVEEYRQVYLNGMRNLIDWLAPTPVKRFVFTSSTSVYGQTDGSFVDETSPTAPDSPTSQVLVETERLLLEAADARRFPAIILRVAGIYGPARGHLFLQYLRNEARLSGQGERVINMIHRDDVVGAIVAALEHGRLGAIYSLADDEPIDQLAFFRWLSGTLGKELPPTVLAGPDTRRKRGLTCKRVSNRKLKADLGYRFKYPTFRQGYAAEIQRLGLSKG